MDMLRHPENLTDQKEALAELIHTLDHPGASNNAARLAIDMMSEQK
jgi:hypothetical protein